MFTTYPVAGIIQYLIQTHNPRAIIVTGSYANGTYNEASDFDCWLIGRDEKRVRHDTSIVNGIELQAEIYPLAYFATMPLHLQRYFADAAIVYDPEELGGKFLQQVQESLHAYPCMPPGHKEQAIAYLEKMLRRASKQDFHGDYRGHLMLMQSLESWCDLSDRVFIGAKKTLRLMEKADAEGATIYRRALRSFEIADIQAWIRYLRTVHESNGSREYRIFEKG